VTTSPCRSQKCRSELRSRCSRRQNSKESAWNSRKPAWEATTRPAGRHTRESRRSPTGSLGTTPPQEWSSRKTSAAPSRPKITRSLGHAVHGLGVKHVPPGELSTLLKVLVKLSGKPLRPAPAGCAAAELEGTEEALRAAEEAAARATDNALQETDQACDQQCDLTPEGQAIWCGQHPLFAITHGGRSGDGGDEKQTRGLRPTQLNPGTVGNASPGRPIGTRRCLGSGDHGRQRGLPKHRRGGGTPSINSPTAG
jgi:hypothetical protein